MSDQSRDYARDGMTVQEAAAMLGISESAVRKRVERGKLDHEHDSDGRLIVYPDTSATGPGRSRRQSHDSATNTSAERYVASLEDQVEYLRRQLSTRDEEIRRRDVIISQLTERLPPQLGPAQEPSESPERTAEDQAKGGGGVPQDRETPTESRPWWRRVFG